MNDETILEEKNGLQPTESTDETVHDNAESVKEAAAEEKKSDSDGKAKESKKGKKRAAAVAGVAMAGMVAGILTPIDVYPDNNNIEGEGIEDVEDGENGGSDMHHDSGSDGHEHLEGHDLPVAHNVDDSMSFGEAFASARQEVGPGGIFEWHGHSYGTYYKTEWDSMSADEKEQYWADVQHTTQELDDEVAQNQDIIDNNDQIVDNDDDNNQDNDDNDVVDNNEDIPDVDDNNVIDNNVVVDNDNETSYRTEFTEDDFAQFADVDGDGLVDVAIVDANGNDIPDMLVDTDADGQLDSMVLDVDLTAEDPLAGRDESDLIPGIEVRLENNVEEGDVLHLSEDQVVAEVDLNEDGQIDTIVADVNDNELPDLIVDTTGNGNFDTVVLDVDVDDNGELLVDVDNVYEIDGVEVTPVEDVDFNDAPELVDPMADNTDIDMNEMDDPLSDNMDIDTNSDLGLDVDSAIGNDMGDMV